MTSIATVIAFLLIPFVCFSQNTSVSALQKKYSNDNVFSLELKGNILRFLDDEPGEKNRSLRILAVSNQSKGYSSLDIRKLKKAIGKQNFEELVSVNSGNGQLRLLVKDRHGKPAELVMIVDKDSEGFVTVDYSEKK